MNSPIKTFIIEEHHEAFIVWNYAIQQGLIPPTGNTLFHVDEHSDMGTPRFNSSILDLNGDLNEIKKFTYSELNIANFIVPAVFREYFNQVFWIKQKHNSNQFKAVNMYVRSYNQSGKRLISGKIKNLEDTQVEDVDKKDFKYYKRTIEQLPNNKKGILDIDLDFFSCSGNPNELNEIEIEITMSEYENFCDNKYHRLNFLNIGKIETKKAGNKFYYIFNNFREIYPNQLNVDKDIIDERINRFVDQLKVSKFIPLIILLCRSRYSGYTPLDKWKYIETKLTDSLESIYPIELKKIQ